MFYVPDAREEEAGDSVLCSAAERGQLGWCARAAGGASTSSPITARRLRSRDTAVVMAVYWGW